jgi:hypothetical protein
MTTASVSPSDRLETLPQGEPELTLGFEVAAWVEGYSNRDGFRGLVQPNGPRARERFRLTRDQLRFLVWWYALDEDGRWLFNHAARRRAKGSGKSPFAAVLALAEFCGPVRLHDFDVGRPGGCVGRPVDMPLVQIAATAESQTANTMRMVRAFAPKGSEIVALYELDPGKTRYYKLPEGTLEVITSSATAAEGGEASLIIADETEHWKPSNGGVELSSTLADNLAKSGSRMMETSNAWVPGIESVAQASWEAWLAQEEGRTRGETKILYDATIAPPDTDLADPESLRRALEHVYADCPWVDVPVIMERIWSLRSRVDDSKRKYLNWPTAAEDAWVAPEEWSRLADTSVEVAEGAEVVLFFDGGKSRDATSLMGCEVESGHVFTLGVWEPDPNDDDDTVDANDVDRVVRLAFERYDVLAFFADVREWESFALTEWPGRYQDDLLLWAVPSGKPPQSIAWDMRSRTVEFAKAAEACHAEITDKELKHFTHDGDPRTARHVGNARRRPYQAWVSIGKESPDSPRKIDAAVCVVGVRMVRRLVLGSPKYKRRRKRSGKAMFLSS